MALPVTPEKASQTAIDIIDRGRRLKARAPGWKTLVSGDHSAELIITEILPDLVASLLIFRASDVAWSTGMKVKIAGYATADLETPPADWWAEYDATRSAIVVVRNRAVTDAAGSGYTVESTGAVTWGTLPANTSLANGLQSLINTLD